MKITSVYSTYCPAMWVQSLLKSLMIPFMTYNLSFTTRRKTRAILIFTLLQTPECDPDQAQIGIFSCKHHNMKVFLRNHD